VDTTSGGPSPLGPVVPLSGVPDGLIARSVQRRTRSPDGPDRIQRDRRGRLRLDEVDLSAQQQFDCSTADLAMLDRPGDITFVLGASSRSWTSIRRRFGERALQLASELAKAGVVTLRCAVTDELKLGTPRGWRITPTAAILAADRSQRTAATQQELVAAIRSALDALAALGGNMDAGPGRAGLDASHIASLREALTRAQEGGISPVRARVFVAAAVDLADGVVHANLRAFSVTHFGDSKARDDAAEVLRHAGVHPAVGHALGLRRSARIGLGAGIDALVGGQQVALSQLDGPVLLRADQPGMQCVLGGRCLVIVENLQSAETLCDRFGQHNEVPAPGVVYTAGFPGREALAHVTGLCRQADAGLLAPDADLGGVRIAAAILGAMDYGTRRKIALCDVGAYSHTPQRKWAKESVSVAGLRDELGGLAGSLADACLRRGYRVEQEETTTAAVVHWLGVNTWGAEG
jgi:hypothetical protein